VKRTLLNGTLWNSKRQHSTNVLRRTSVSRKHTRQLLWTDNKYSHSYNRSRHLSEKRSRSHRRLSYYLVRKRQIHRYRRSHGDRHKASNKMINKASSME
jgi:hypothetical protein